MQRAVDLDPVSPIINTNLATAYYFARQNDRAIEQYRKALDLDPDFGLAHRYLMEAYAEKGMFREAIEEFTKGGYSEGATAEGTAQLQQAYTQGGAKGYWRERLDLAQQRAKYGYIPPSRMALLSARLGEKDKALEWLERAIAEHDAWVFWLKVSPDYDTLRSDPRYAGLMRRMGLPQ
jgi:tetratricopeptide (TPR) repeat protein